MFKRLLVPLDGSLLAESVLPAAVYLAERFTATMVLFHVVESGAPSTVHGQRHLLDAAEAQAYLEGIAARLARPNVAIETNVHPAGGADVARSIIEHTSELKADLILLCAHGRGGLRDFLIGGIAQRVIQGGATPVFFVRPNKEGRAPLLDCRRILIPLDGTQIHEPAMPVAAEIARQCHAVMHLLTIVPTPHTLSAERAGTRLLLPTTMTALLDLAQRGAVEYLQGKVKELLVSGLSATAEVARGDVALSILDTAERSAADLIVLATHGRASIDAFWSGSVTPKVLARSVAPVLLVRVSGEEAAR
jgi:nucleotide-binding universal stress UspA family protein